MILICPLTLNSDFDALSSEALLVEIFQVVSKLVGGGLPKPAL